MDYALLKIRNYGKEDNYYKVGKLYFSKYKTAAKYGAQTVDVPKDLDKLIKKWIKLNDTHSFLFSSNKQPLSSSQIARLLNKAFDKPASVDAMRHIYLSNLYKDVPSIQQMEATANAMGHSTGQAMLYVKKS
jgi:integrase